MVHSNPFDCRDESCDRGCRGAFLDLLARGFHDITVIPSGFRLGAISRSGRGGRERRRRNALLMTGDQRPEFYPTILGRCIRKQSPGPSSQNRLCCPVHPWSTHAHVPCQIGGRLPALAHWPQSWIEGGYPRAGGCAAVFNEPPSSIGIRFSGKVVNPIRSVVEVWE
jgi:hypothetical protein